MSDYFYSFEALLFSHAVQLGACGGHDLNRACATSRALFFIADENNH